jgi:phage gp37-like protein
VPAGTDHGHGVEPGALVVHRIVGPKDAALEQATAAGLQVLVGRYSVEKYHGEVSPETLYEIVETPPNLFLTAGVTKLWQLAAGISSTHLDATNARLAVGDSSTAAAAAQSDLVGTNKVRKIVSGAPVISGNQITFSTQFGTGEANFAWLEVGVANDASGQLISRSALTAPGLGTKVNTAVWVLNWSLAIS